MCNTKLYKHIPRHPQKRHAFGHSNIYNLMAEDPESIPGIHILMTEDPEIIFGISILMKEDPELIPTRVSLPPLRRCLNSSWNHVKPAGPILGQGA